MIGATAVIMGVHRSSDAGFGRGVGWDWYRRR